MTNVWSYDILIVQLLTMKERSENMISTIKKYRERSKITQDELAKRLSITQGAISQWENGLSFPKTELLPRIAELLGCTVDELLSGETEDKAVL